MCCTFPGADDGTRTRDPHLGKVIWHGSLTCGNGARALLTSEKTLVLLANVCGR